jgi:hypothetical protein
MQYTAGSFTRYFGYRGQLGMGGAIKQQPMTVAASQTIATGDILKLTGGGGVLTVEQFIAAPAASNYTVTANAAIIGVALEPIATNASGVSTNGSGKTAINVAIFDDNLQIALRLLGVTATGSTAVSTLGGASELQDLTLGTGYAVGRYTDADGASFYFVSAQATNGQLRYVEPIPAANAADDFGVPYLSCVQSFRALG